MREEEIAKRLKDAFPDITPPDDALQARIRCLESHANSSRQKRARWKTAFISIGAVGVGGLLVSRALVGYVLYQHDHASIPETILSETVRYNDPLEPSIERIWKSGNQVHRTYKDHNPKVPIRHRLFMNDKSYNWTEGRESQGTVVTIVKPAQSYDARVKITDGTGQMLVLGEMPQAPPWHRAIWSIPWIVRMPDHISNGHREWVLQQTYRSSGESSYRRIVWGINAETGQLKWTESWYLAHHSSGRLITRNTFTYSSATRTSLFKVPEGLKEKPTYGELPAWSIEPVIKPYAAPLSWSKWWDEFLTNFPL